MIGGVTDFQTFEDLPSKNITSEGLRGGGGDIIIIIKLITSELKPLTKAFENKETLWRLGRAEEE